MKGCFDILSPKRFKCAKLAYTAVDSVWASVCFLSFPERVRTICKDFVKLLKLLLLLCGIFDMIRSAFYSVMSQRATLDLNFAMGSTVCCFLERCLLLADTRSFLVILILPLSIGYLHGHSQSIFFL